MLAAENRMRDGAAFRGTVRSGRKAGASVLVVHTTRVPGRTGSAEVGFVVGKAVGGAVARNRVRRRLRHQIRAVMVERPELLPPGAEVVVRALPSSAASSSAELRAALVRCLERVVPGAARDLDGSAR